MDAKGIIESLRPDTNNLIVLAVTVVIIYSIYMLGSEASRLADTAMGGLIGYLGSSAKDRRPQLPGDVAGGKA